MCEQFRVVLHLFTGSLAGIGKLPALASWYIWFGIFCTVRFGGSSILWNFAGTPFCKFGRNLFFPQKGGLIHQKGGRSLHRQGSASFVCMIWCIVCVVRYIGFCIICYLHCTHGNDVEGVNGNCPTMTPALQLPLLVVVVIPPQAFTL